MKITVRDTPKGMEVYVAKKDLEELIVDSEHPGIWGGWAKLTNGWVFDMPAYDTPPSLPITIEARRLSTE
ncbi:putative nitrogen fixation protein NifT [Rhodovulum sp. BSW8]|uniref:Nitrogen fixation protein NifT n=1 Tax=Rhodovulum visakhapatnamense TaxID=364297 RepID=A0A4R8G5V0_9RHOB|nr:MULTISPECIES: putative nitrogen fixation protein NifT [Rhodovulum]OLS45504.1 putative nitrogen fixation protein NifT [Rhodovulum sulfidophilum]MBL3570839.1 putative nitrogen fixation protein NifT [Rhodovulum visakhapatnamense]MBL3578784.1 putative nitrogen fixation protein NifT [Rhodovulum visakhapatnamense]RBO53093.1 putative nitrogen fixation protein NifT [Rhodovulum sp. BSW8]TDX33813.1 nitrogen fixation protein NifT [Rhodovulum visakhapatnamense]